MITKAIIKINEEMQKNPQDKYTEIIGHYLIDRCNDAETAEKLLKDGKSLKGAMDAVLTAAKKKKQGDVAVLMPQEVFAEVDGYFALSTDETEQQKAIMSVMGASAAPVKQKEEKKLALTLEAFL